MAFVLLFTGTILTWAYIANGSERKDLWLYLSSAFIALSVTIPEFFKKKGEQ
jgi:hypothetical protein